MAYYDRRYNQSSIIDSFTLSPLPWPVILILLMVFFFLGIHWFFSFEDFMETAEEEMSLIKLFVPLILILIIRWVSSMENFDGFLGFYWNDRRNRANYARPMNSDGSDGSSPWGVAALLILILILASFHSTIQDMWKP